MPGPTEVGQSRSRVVRGILAALVVIALVAAVAVVIVAVRRERASDAAVSRPRPAEEAAFAMIPAPGSTGSATCTDPVGQQEWRVTWRAARTVPPSPTPAVPTSTVPATTAATPAVPTRTVPATTVTATTTLPPSAVPATTPSATAIPSPATAATVEAERAERAAAVTLIPTGFAVRPLPGATAISSPTTVAPTSAASTSTPPATIPSTGSTPADGWQSRDADTWLLRWSPTLAEVVTAAKDEQWERAGPLATLAAMAMTVRQDPRFVTPDGACSVYLAPFVSGAAGDRNAVAVIGDSLVAQLYASEDGTATGTGILLNRLTTAGDRAEIAGQGGRRWTIKPNIGSGLEAADASMLDEIRGVREARSVVIALGTNDAGWVALAPNQEQYELRLAWVLMHLAPILDELRDQGHCTVLATMATRNKSYLGSLPGRFDAAAIRINDYLRQRADADQNDRLRLWDWAVHADGHGTTDPEPWFGTDTIHLTQAGLAPYADELASAAALC